MSTNAFATLKPANALARLAFSNLYETFISRRQSISEEGPLAFRRMVVEASQTLDPDVLRLELERRRHVSQKAYASDAETSDSLSELDRDTEKQHEELGTIWTGHYILAFSSWPHDAARGWTAGKCPLGGIVTDLLLCTNIFARWHGINLRNPHARINFVPENRSLYIAGCSSSQSARVVVNGDAVARRRYMLNQHSMSIWLDKLEYTFQWTDYAATKGFIDDRARYVVGAGGPLEVDIDMPTPLPNTRTMGKWTLGKPLGAGGHGRVFLATNTSGGVAALKIMERKSRNASHVDAEVQICNEVTAFAQVSDDGGRILRAVEVLYTDGKKFSSETAFDNVTIVMQPMTPETLADMCGPNSKGGSKGMKIKAAKVFRDALIGLQVMHKGGWMHCDLKPPNIGVIGSPARAVLLDVGTSAHLQHGTKMKSRPGTVGTMGYLAPEFELEEYDHGIDIWAMGIILYHLTYGYHPWKFALNPWRDGLENERLRPQFCKMYQEAIDRMVKGYHNARRSPTEGYIHRECPARANSPALVWVPSLWIW
ncbi:kinase-like domain-containing protein [Xylaria grammica]|nr:kinase-like domain-containing protein [Xylaria grammica]